MWLLSLVAVALVVGWRLVVGELISLDENLLEPGQYALSAADNPPSEIFAPTGLYVAEVEMEGIPCVVKVVESYLDNTLTIVQGKVKPGGLKFRTMESWRLGELGTHEIVIAAGYPQRSPQFSLSTTCTLEWVPP